MDSEHFNSPRIQKMSPSGSGGASGAKSELICEIFFCSRFTVFARWLTRLVMVNIRIISYRLKILKKIKKNILTTLLVCPKPEKLIINCTKMLLYTMYLSL